MSFHDPRITIGELWLNLAEAMGHQTPSAPALTMMLDAVNDLDPDRVIEALRNWMRGPNGRRFPLPADIREAVGAHVDKKTIAVDSSSRIVESVSKFGLYQARAARAHIGELGWRAVERMGGWENLCAHLGTRALPITMAQAQLRDICESLQGMAFAGLLEKPAGIPIGPGQGENQVKIQSLVGDTMGKLEESFKSIDSKNQDKGGDDESK